MRVARSIGAAGICSGWAMPPRWGLRRSGGERASDYKPAAPLEPGHICASQQWQLTRNRGAGRPAGEETADKAELGEEILAGFFGEGVEGFLPAEHRIHGRRAIQFDGAHLG